MPRTPTKDLDLAIDVGTGSVRAALVNRQGEIVGLCVEEHDQIVSAFGWAEQRPRDWWSGVVKCIRGVLSRSEAAAHRIGAVCVCGQMHGTVLLDQSGELLRERSPLWNDKRVMVSPHISGITTMHGAITGFLECLSDLEHARVPKWVVDSDRQN